MAENPRNVASAQETAIEKRQDSYFTSEPSSDSAPPREVDVESALERHESITDAESLASIDRPPSREEKLVSSAIVYHPFHPEVIALLAIGAVFGTLARLGIQTIVKYDGESIFPLAYVQSIGCLFMGFTLRFREPLGDFYAPLYTAITTGFCGSLTTFSSWQVDVFFSWINETGSHRDWLRDVIDGCTKIFFTLSLSIASVQFGVHLGSLLAPYVPLLRPPPRLFRYSLCTLSILIYFATYPAYFHLPSSFRHQATAALLFCYPGVLTRYILSIKLNPLYKTLPLGTLVANLFGTGLLATFHVLQGLSDPVSASACALLQGLGDGYCGCLTTVSTFAVEVTTLSTRKAWFYAATTVILGQLVVLVICGPSFWAGHVSAQGSCVLG